METREKETVQPQECIAGILGASGTVEVNKAMGLIGILTRKTMYRKLNAGELSPSFKLGDHSTASWLIPRHALLTYWLRRMGQPAYDAMIAHLIDEGHDPQAERERRTHLPGAAAILADAAPSQLVTVELEAHVTPAGG